MLTTKKFTQNSKARNQQKRPAYKGKQKKFGRTRRKFRRHTSLDRLYRERQLASRLIQFPTTKSSRPPRLLKLDVGYTGLLLRKTAAPSRASLTKHRFTPRAQRAASFYSVLSTGGASMRHVGRKYRVKSTLFEGTQARGLLHQRNSLR